MLIETRGRKPKKQYEIEAGQIYQFDPSEIAAIRYRAKREEWKIETRNIDGKLIVFRSK